MARSFLGGEFAGGESAWWRGDWIPFLHNLHFTEDEESMKEHTLIRFP